MVKISHTCAYCKKHYPSGQTTALFAGGGECHRRITSSLKSQKECQFFEPLKRISIAQFSFYELRYEIDERRVSRIVLHDNVMGVPIVEFPEDSCRKCLAMATRYFENAERYFTACIRQLTQFQTSSRNTLPVFMGGMEFEPSDKYDGTSVFSRHFRLFLKHNASPIQTNFYIPLMIGRKTCEAVTVRILHDDDAEDGIRIMVKHPEQDRFVRLEGLRQNCRIGNDFISYIIDEFEHYRTTVMFFLNALMQEKSR